MGLFTRLVAPRPGSKAKVAVSKTKRPAASPATNCDFSVDIDGATLVVRVRRHPRARRLRLRYDAALGELKLVMPPRGSIDQARRWVAGQTVWINGQRASRAPAEAVGHGTILPWRDASLRIDWSVSHPRAPRIEGDALLLGGPEASIGRRVRRWLEDQARSEFTAASHAMAQRGGLQVAAITVGDPRSRWGSCTSTGRIRYNWRLVMAPDHVRTAIVAHEVAHLAHMNHGPEFYALVERLCGDAHDRSRLWLKRHGAALHRWRFEPA